MPDVHFQDYHAKIRGSRRDEERYKSTYKEGIQNVSAKKKGKAFRGFCLSEVLIDFLLQNWTNSSHRNGD